MKNGILQILFANLINLALGIVTGFVLPKYLTVGAYGAVKTYQLYITYIGFFHLGFVDGIYLLYGGKKANQLDQQKFNQRKYALILIQTIMTVIMLLIAMFLKDWIFAVFAITILPFNFAMFYKMVYQAIGEFKKYSYIINATSILNMCGILILMLFRAKASQYFIGMYFLCYLLIALSLIKVGGKSSQPLKFDWSDTVDIIKSGFVLMLGNFSGLVLSGMDRWCVKFLIKETSAFSFYSFAVSLQYMVDAFVSPITIVLYNYLCGDVQEQMIIRLKRMCLYGGILLMCLVFPCKWIVEHFIEKYVDSLHVLVILFITELLYLLIKGIYVNLYKAQKMQTVYFKKMLLVIVVGLILNLIGFHIFGVKEIFAYATLFSTLFWLIISITDFKEAKLSLLELGILLGSIGIFLFCGIKLNTYIGFFVYAIYLLILSILFFRQEICYFWDYFKNDVLSKLHLK